LHRREKQLTDLILKNESIDKGLITRYLMSEETEQSPCNLPFTPSAGALTPSSTIDFNKSGGVGLALHSANID